MDSALPWGLRRSAPSSGPGARPGQGRELCPCCLPPSTGSSSLHPDASWYKSSHSLGVVEGLLWSLKLPNTYQVSGPWELPAKFCTYFGTCLVFAEFPIHSLLYRTLTVEANRCCLEKANTKSLQEWREESYDRKKAVTKSNFRANFRLSFLLRQHSLLGHNRHCREWLSSPSPSVAVPFLLIP